MEKYSKYKDSGVKWIGDVPAHWNMLRAKNMFVRMAREVRDEDDIITCFRDGQVTLRKNRRIEGFTESFKEVGYQGIRKGDLVIHQMDAFAGSIGVSDSDGKGTPVYICLQPKDNNSNYYYAFLLREMARTGFIKSLYRGIRERSSDFRYETFAKLFLPLPPLAEQRAIVSYLDGKVGQIDTYIAKQTQQIELLKELKQAVIANAVTKGIANDNNHHTKQKQSGISWIGEIPEHWEVKRLGLFFTENKTINSCMQCIEAYKFNYGTLIRKDEDIDPNELKDIYNKYTILKPRDIVINGLNLNYDFVSQRVALSTSTGIITSAYIVLSPRTRVHELFFYYLLKSMDGMKLFHGMGTGIRLTLSFKDLKYQLLPIPPLSEQRAIVSYIEAQTANIDKLIDAYQQQVERIKEYKQRLISDAVTGKMNVTGKQTQTN